MQQRTITVTLKKAKEWYNSDNESLREIALKAFDKEELEPFDFKKIKTFEDALDALGYLSVEQNMINSIVNSLFLVSKASAAMFMLNIIRRALNKGYDLHLTKNIKNEDCIWYPYPRFITKDSTYFSKEIKSGKYKKIGEIINEGVTYDVIASDAYIGSNNGLGDFHYCIGVGYANIAIGCLGCATEEIAKHFGEYFGMLIMEAMYGDMVDFKIIKK